MTTKVFSHILLCLALLQLLTGCANLDDGYLHEVGTLIVDPFEPTICTVVRFEAADGQNILGWFDDIRQGGGNHFVAVDDQWLDIRCVRGSDGAEMTFFTKTIYATYEAEVSVFGDGPRLCLSWLDFDWYMGQNVTFPLHETYTIHIRSTRFWLGEERTIEWGIDVKSRYEYEVTSCAIDGVSSAEYLEAAFEDGLFLGRVTLKARPESQYPNFWDYPVIPHNNL